jgi:hypothetical protein
MVIVFGIVAASVLGAVTISQDQWSTINTVLLIILALVSKRSTSKANLNIWSNMRRLKKLEAELLNDGTGKRI